MVYIKILWLYINFDRLRTTLLYKINIRAISLIYPYNPTFYNDFLIFYKILNLYNIYLKPFIKSEHEYDYIQINE